MAIQYNLKRLMELYDLGI